MSPIVQELHELAYCNFHKKLVMLKVSNFK